MMMSVMFSEHCSLTSDGGTPSLLPKHPAPSLKSFCQYYPEKARLPFFGPIFARYILTHKLEQVAVGGGQSLAPETLRARLNPSRLKLNSGQLKLL